MTTSNKYSEELNSQWAEEFPLTDSTKRATKYAWKCPEGHPYMATLVDRDGRARGCPYCAGKGVLKGYNDVATVLSHLMPEWDWDKNTLSPYEISGGSKKKVWWLCPEFNHSYDATPEKRKIGRGCGVCGGKRATGGNSIADLYPEWLEEWDYEKNVTTPEKVRPGSSIKRFWIGKSCGHSYEKAPKFKAKNSHCPYCAKSNSTLLRGTSDLLTMYPHVAKEFHPTKNGKMTSSDISGKSGKRVWWLCGNDPSHEWMTTIYNRTNHKSNCPFCAQNGTSLKEKSIFDFIRSSFPHYQVIQGDRSVISPYEIDIYIPELRVGVEFNGTYWHSDALQKNKQEASSRHMNKIRRAKNVGASLLIVWEDEWDCDPESVKALILRFISEANGKIKSSHKVGVDLTELSKVSDYFNFRQEEFFVMEAKSKLIPSDILQLTVQYGLSKEKASIVMDNECILWHQMDELGLFFEEFIEPEFWFFHKNKRDLNKSHSLESTLPKIWGYGKSRWIPTPHS